MARVAPEAAVHDQAGVGGVGLEAGELEIAARLESEPDHPHRDAEPIEHPEVRAAVDGGQQRQ